MRINHAGGVKSPGIFKGKYDSLRGKGYSILLCTPTLDGNVRVEYTTSLVKTIIALGSLGIPVTIAKNTNSCFVDLSRNLFVAQFMAGDYSHLLQIDSDMSWNETAVLDMLMRDKEFISGIGRKKLDAEEYAGINHTNENGTVIGELGDTEEDVLISMKYIGGAFTLQKRSMFQTLINRWGRTHKAMLGTTEGYSFYQCRYYDSAFMTEDYYFCDLCERSGIDVWCYANIDMGHHGTRNYQGNFFKYLKGLKEPQKVAA